MSTSSRRTTVIGAAVGALVVVVLLVVVLASRSGSDGSTAAVADDRAQTSTATAGSDAPDAGGDEPANDPAAANGSDPAAAPGSSGGSEGATAAAELPTGPYTTPDMPVQVDVSGVDGLGDGQPVTVHVTPSSGSQVYGAEARLCAASAAVRYDAEFTPTMSGLCAPVALSSASDSRVTVAADPPYQSVDLTFRVGVGSATFPTQRGTEATVACGPESPCQLVLKLQFPDGFGFQGVPLTFG